MFAVPFDTRRLEMRGTPVAILNGIAYQTQSGGADFDVTAGETLVYRKGDSVATDLARLEVIGAGGRRTAVTPDPAPYQQPSFSPVDDRVAVTVFRGEKQGLWIFDLASGGSDKLPVADLDVRQPVWTPDGRSTAERSRPGLQRVANCSIERKPGSWQSHTPLTADRFPLANLVCGSRISRVLRTACRGTGGAWSVSREHDRSGPRNQTTRSCSSRTFSTSCGGASRSINESGY